MGEDLLAFLFVLFVLFVLVSLPVTFATGLTACIAYSRTKTWDKQRRLAASPSYNNLPTTTTSDDNDVDSDSEFYYDTEDEEDQRKQRADDEADRFLTFGQKFRKEMRSVWRGDGGKGLRRAQKEERRRLAKAVVREMEWRERRREKRERKRERFGKEVV